MQLWMQVRAAAGRASATSAPTVPMCLIGAGLAVLVLGCWVVRVDFAETGQMAWWTQALTVGIAVGAVVIVVARDWRVKLWAWGLAVAGAGVVVLGVLGFLYQFNSGFPGRQTVLAAVGGLAVLVGAVMLSSVPDGNWPRPTRESGLFGLAAFVLVPALAWPLAMSTADWRLAATTAPAGVPAAVPATVSKVAWSIEVDGEIKEVVGGGPGALVRFSDGVAAVDGTTGQIRWSHRRAGADADAIDVSPDGRTVILQIRQGNRRPLRTEVLDAITGDVRYATDSAPRTFSIGGFYRPMTNTSYITADEDRSEFDGISLVDGRRLWTFSVPAGCRSVGGVADGFAQANGMLLPLRCNEKEFRLVSVDGTTGLLRWQHVVTSTEQFSFRLNKSSDHELAAISLGQDLAKSSFVIDTETGAVVSEGSSLSLRSAGRGVVDKTLVDIRTSRAITGSAASNQCVAVDDSGLSGGAVCPAPEVEMFRKVRATGVGDFLTTRLGGAEVTPLPVPLGGPFIDADGDRYSEPYRVAAGPGAVFLYSEFTPVAGVKPRLVGLS